MTYRKLTGPLAIFLVAFFLQDAATTGQPSAAREGQLFNAVPARCIGPANFGGRITDVAVVESNPAIMYIASATGGIWKTTDGGANCQPVFDQAGSLCIGAVAVSPSNPSAVWVGTGEGNILRSISVGDGVYRSTDGGRSWRHVGLKETRHIGRIVIHPRNQDVVYVAALGRSWGMNSERGLYKTGDGGRTWEKVLYIDETTGVVDVAMDPSDPDTLYAAAYTFRRDAFSGTTPRIEFGPKAGLYKTTDGGKTWERLTTGLPARPLGRCGISICRKDPNIVFALVQTDKSGTGGGKGGGMGGAKDDKDSGGIYRSEDKGMTWKRVQSFFGQFPFYFGQIRVDPNDDQRLYYLEVAFRTSTNGGKDFQSSKAGHDDNHSLWINPSDSNHLVLGNDGGLFISTDKAKTWKGIRHLPTGQFYAIGVDMSKPYRVYGGLQDNGSWGGPSATDNDRGIALSDWRTVNGGDGFYCQVDPSDPNTVYCESQEGILRRVDLKAPGGMGGGKGGGFGGGGNIKPKQAKGEDDPYRFNWSSPILISPHDPKTIFFGGQYLFKSANRGDNWEKISADLSRGGVKQDTGHTITNMAESPVKAGVIWAGTDDGRVHVTTNGGKDWTEVTKNVPALISDAGWITRLECSHFAEGTVYLAVDRHRNDDLRPYIYKTTDFGTTWKPISGNLPAEGNVHCVRESSKNPDLLFVGTEFGLYGTLDGGQHWHHMKTGLPAAVLVHDLVIHPRDRELVVGTHGRSIYVIDISPLEELTPAVLQSDAHLFDVRPAKAFEVKTAPKASDGGYVAPNPAFGATVYFYTKDSNLQQPTVSILDKQGFTVISFKGQRQAGLQKVQWNLRAQEGEKLVAPGEYTARLQMGAKTISKTIKVEAE